MAKNMWLWEMASKFGMNVEQFTEFVGYSKQTLYKASWNNLKLKPSRLAVSLYKLERTNEDMFEAEKAETVRRYEERRKLIESFAERFS